MDSIAVVVSSASTALLSWVGVARMRSLSIEKNWMDVPNARSSHEIPTPRGGGLAVLVSIFIAAIALTLLGVVSWQMLLALSPSALIGFVGFVDDRRGLSAGKRLSCHLLCALFATVAVSALTTGSPVLDFGTFVLSNVFLVASFSVLFIAWMTNLYNFMDGIDGIEGVQVVTVAVALGLVAFLRAEDTALAALYFISASAFLGFLMLNWPPAKIFLGDVGSGAIGFLLATLAMTGVQRGAISLPAILILHGSFIVDTAFTLIVRISKGQRPQEAHRTHAYQKAVRRGWSHARVSSIYGFINIGWLLPWAIIALNFPVLGLPLIALAWLPLVAGCWVLKAGQEPV